ncbi:Insulinase (Peptidase M16) [Podila epigama]|nr:Insulinase (Peptidase M16) [Podila epigama]
MHESTLPDGYEYAKDKSHAVFTRPIEKSLNDEREYRLILLNNSLQVLLIHDPTADKAAAAMDVHVGHLSDPDNLQGLAHFLEHLLFLGTEKYPRENEYKEYLAQHSGKSNASTGLDNTTFHFEVGIEYLEGALDRFAQFFISPAFNKDCKDREIRAVDSEFKRNLQQDSRRQFQLGKTLSNPHHPYWHFSTGNLITLDVEPTRAGIDVRDELIKFHAKCYSASIMKLVILGREPLEQLAQWAVEKFSPVKNLGIAPPSYPHGPLTANELLRTTFIKPVKNLRSLTITFPYPDQTLLYAEKPAEYIGHLIGHEGPGSILSLLRRNGWADKLSTGTSSGGLGFSFLKISIDLTPEGLERYEDVTAVVFQYIKLIQEQGLKPYIWDEVSSLSSISFRFKEKSPAAAYVTSLVRIMQRGYSPETTISGADLIREYNPSMIQESVNCLSTDRWHSTLVTQNVNIVPGQTFTHTERWYGTEYHVSPVPTQFLERLKDLELHPELRLPEHNDFVPTNFDTHRIPITEPASAPILLKHTPMVRLWHKKDDTFWVPKVNIYFRLASPLVMTTPANFVKTVIFVRLVKDSLKEQVYSAELAGLMYSLDVSVDGIVLKVEGYNDKALVLLRMVIQRIRTYTVDPDRFHLIHEKLEREYANFQMEEPSRLAIYYMSQLLQEKQWTYKEKLTELKGLTPGDVQMFIPLLFSRLHIEGLVHGNMDQTDALEACTIIEATFASRSLSACELVPARSYMLPQGARIVFQKTVPNPTNVNSAIEYYVQIDHEDCEDLRSVQDSVKAITTRRRTHSALTQILAQILQEPCFNQLRTNEQLGYIVQSSTRSNASSTGVRIVVQSERDPVYVQSRIQHFLSVRVHNLLRDMTEADFERQVRSLINKKLESDKHLKQETTRYWDHICSGFYDFAQIQEEVNVMAAMTLNDARMFFDSWLEPRCQKTRLLAVHLCSQRLSSKVEPKEDAETDAGSEDETNADAAEEESAGEERLAESVVIKNHVQFKAGLKLGKAPTPVEGVFDITSGLNVPIRSTL